MPKRNRKAPVIARADPRTRDDRGVLVVASYQTLPPTTHPVKIRGRKIGEPDRVVLFQLTAAEGEKAARDILSFLGLGIDEL